MRSQKCNYTFHHRESQVWACDTTHLVPIAHFRLVEVFDIYHNHLLGCSIFRKALSIAASKKIMEKEQEKEMCFIKLIQCGSCTLSKQL